MGKDEGKGVKQEATEGKSGERGGNVGVMFGKGEEKRGTGSSGRREKEGNWGKGKRNKDKRLECTETKGKKVDKKCRGKMN